MEVATRAYIWLQ